MMNQESLFPYQRRFAYDLAKLQSVAAGFDFQLRSGHEIEPITQLLWNHDPPGAINGNSHGAMVLGTVSSMSRRCAQRVRMREAVVAVDETGAHRSHTTVHVRHAADL